MLVDNNRFSDKYTSTYRPDSRQFGYHNDSAISHNAYVTVDAATPHDAYVTK